MAVKKTYKLIASLVLCAAVLVCLFLVSARSIHRDVSEQGFEISAMQFGDLADSAEAVPSRVIRGASLASENVSEITPINESAYTTVVSGLLAEKSEISLSGKGLTPSDVQKLMTKAINSNPALFYVESGYAIGSHDGTTVEYIRPTYKASGSDLERMRSEYETLVSDILGKVNSSWSSFEKVLFIHDYMVKNYEYDYSYSIYDSYTMLKEKKGVCQAYTLLCIELLRRLDIGVGAVPSESMNHVWNCVELGGKWYHMDITWSDASAPGNYDRFDEIGYSNFLCSDSAITASGHSDWESDIVFSDDYDNLFLKTNGRIKASALGDDWYVLIGDSNNSELGVSICLADFEGNSYSKKEFIKARWYAWKDSGRYYTDHYAGLDSYFDALVISTADTLYAYNPSTGTVRLGSYTYENGYIYGMKINGSTATLRVATYLLDYANDSFASLDLSDITFDLEVSYEDKGGQSIAEKYSVKVGWGESFTVNNPELDGYAAENSTVSGKMTLGGMSVTALYKSYATLKIDYIYENGERAAESYISSALEVGSQYSVISPAIDGYYPSIATVSGTMSSGGVTVTVTYRQDKFNLTVHYVYEDGSKAADTVVLSDLEYLAPYSAISPEISGYEPDIAEACGNISEDVEITVTYRVMKCTVKVSYYYPNGDLISENEVILDYGSDYDIVSPSVRGHTPEAVSVSGKADRKNIQIPLSYTVNRYTLTVKYIYADRTEAAEAYSVELDYGEAYSIVSPSITHFRPSVAKVIGNMTDSDTEIDVIYTLAKYKVEFRVDGDLFYSELVEYGSSVPLPDSAPLKDSSAQTVYTFRCWDGLEEGMTVSENITFVALFDESVRKYSVVFKNYDGSILYETEVEYNGNAVYTGETPTRASEDGRIYTFVGWDEDTENITENSVFTAMFSDGITQHTVSFYDADGNLLKSEKVYHGHSATPPTVPAEYADNTYNYYFVSWIGKYKRVTSDTTVKASYNAVYIEYKVVFKDHDGSIISEQKLHYGDKISIPADPTRSSDERYDYVFKKWSSDPSDIACENAEYIAIYDAISRFEFDTDDLEDALYAVRTAKTESERFEALLEALAVRDGMYTADPEVAEALSELENEIKKYNSEINSINAGFAKANENIASAMTLDATALSALLIIWELLKKLVGIN